MAGQEVTIHAGADMLSDPVAFEQGQRVAKLFAASELVPIHLRDKPANCFIALYMAKRLGEDPLIVMQNIHIINGKAGWSAQYMIGRANRSGVFQRSIVWETEGTGDAMKVTAKAILSDGRPVSAEASMAMAKAEGWTKNAKYQSMPEHMLRWRSATFLIRLYAPEVMLGIPMADEVEDVSAAHAVDVTPPRPKIEEYRAKAPTQAQASPKTKQRSAVPIEQDIVPSYAIIDSDGEIFEFAFASDAAKHLGDLLLSAAKGNSLAAFDGIWESNDGFLTALFAKRTDYGEVLRNTYETFRAQLAPDDGSQPDPLEASVNEMIAWLNDQSQMRLVDNFEKKKRADIDALPPHYRQPLEKALADAKARISKGAQS